MFNNITNQLFCKIIDECKKDSIKTKINNHIIDPIIYYIYKKIYPYALLILLISILILIFSIIILIQIIFYQNK